MTTYQRQLLLEYLGVSPGPLDGLDGPKTREACRRFQSAFGLPATGAFDDATDHGLIDAVSGAMTPVDKPQSAADSDWWEDIRYFKRSEFACKCGRCGGFPAEPREEMVRIADKIRGHFGSPAYVVSGLRCPAHNRAVGGKANSQHMYGEACDIRVDGVGWSELLAYTKSLPGVRYAYHIEGSNNIHFDIPAKPSP